MVTYSLLLFTDCLSVGSLDHAASDRLVEVIREVVGVVGGLPILNAVNTTAPQLQPKHFILSPNINYSLLFLPPSGSHQKHF